MQSDSTIDLSIALRKIHELSLEGGDLGHAYWFSIGKLLERAAGMQAEIDSLNNELEKYEGKSRAMGGVRLERSVTDIQATAIAEIFAGTSWSTTHTANTAARHEATDRLAELQRWRSERKVFAIELEGEALYPRYVFDELGDPVPVITQVLAVFREYSPIRIAGWFESTNSMLRGQRRREMSAIDPSAVLEAAQDHVVGSVHG